MKLDSLQEIFNQKTFRIPDYQRGYSWGKRQCRDLWQDIDILPDCKDHYTGVLTVVSNGDEISIVDGQQRITTLIILIQVIYEKLVDDGEKWVNEKEIAAYEKQYLHFKRGRQGEILDVVFGYQEDNPSHTYFKQKILGVPDTTSGVPDRTLYTRNLIGAKNFFKRKVKNLNFENLEDLLKKITTRLRFNYYELDGGLNQFVAFETMNNRGKPLSTLELLKNRLIYLSTLLPKNDEAEKEDLRKDINNAWKTVYEFLGKNPKSRLVDDDFLRDHWIMNFQYSRDASKVYRDFLLLRHFTAKRTLTGKLILADIREYVTDIKKAVKAYYYLHNPTDSSCFYSEDIKKWISKLNRLGFGAFTPLLTSILIKKWDNQRVLSVLECAERFVFVAFSVYFHRSNKMNSRIYGYAHQIHTSSSQWSENEIQENLTLSRLKIKDQLNTENFLRDVECNFYNWKGLKYFLYEYELHLKEFASGDDKVFWGNVNNETIEHIYPQSPDTQWKKFSHEDEELLHDLGNLLLLSRKKNSALQNVSFSEKCNHAKHGYKKGSYSAIEVADESDWTPESIIERRNKLIDFLCERWDLEKVEC